MPGKSKHGKGKRYQINRKATPPRQNAAAAPAAAKAIAPQVVAPVRAAPAGKAAAAQAIPADLYAHVPGDLRRIGVLSVLIMVILIILYFVLR